MLGYMPTITADVLSDRFDKIQYLIGDFTLDIYSVIQESLGWVKTGEGSSIVTFENSFIIENVEVIKENYKISIHNTFACDLEKDTFKLVTLANNNGQMNVYNGLISGDILTFCNVEPEMKIDKEDNDSLCIKLIYRRISDLENELIIGSSKDKGKTWHPCVKTIYRRKNII